MRVFIFLIAITSLVSCQTDLEIPFPKHEPKLVLNSYMIEDGAIFLYLTRSFGALETVNDTNLIVRDAEVSVWKDGTKLADMSLLRDVNDTIIFEGTPGVLDTFIQNVIANVYLPDVELPAPKPGETYEFRAVHPTYGAASGQLKVLPKPEILSTELVRDSITTTDFDGYQDVWSAMKIRVQDPGEYNNYYNFGMRLKYVQEYDDGFGNIFIDTTDYFTSVATGITRSPDGVVYGDYNPVSDAEINGQTSELFAWIRLPNCCGYPGDLSNRPEIELLEIGIEVYIMDENFGLFDSKHRLQYQSRTEGIESAILPREPVSVNGNVVDGYGLIASFNYLYQEVEL